MKRQLLFPSLILIVFISFAQQIGSFLRTSVTTFYPLPERAKYVTPVGDDRVYYVSGSILSFNDKEAAHKIKMDATFGQIIGAANGYIYFSASTDKHGEELYRHNGSEVEFVKDITKGSEGTGFHYNASATIQNQLFFVAEDNVNGRELWVTDGKNTELVADLAPGKKDAIPGSLTSIDHKLYFSASDGNQRELYVFDGSVVTKIQNDDDTGYRSVGAASLEVVSFRNEIYFTAADANGNNEIWKYNGTSVSKAINLHPEIGTEPEELTVFKDKLLFQAYHGMAGLELFEFDGKELKILAEITPNQTYVHPQKLTVLNDLFYFKTENKELWSYDGQSIAQVERN